MKKVINFKLKVVDNYYLSPDYISTRILSALSTKAFDHNYRVDFDAYALAISEEGIPCKVIDIVDYGYEKFALLDVKGNRINISIKDDIKGEVFINVDFNKVGITETSIDMKLI